ncbi:unnamed protein product [Clonostachys chloroleuca]|uniref:Uncharacterized protein n=1 Tax=Clonostachys chloroleuca TaxID=1926264 RepID=A0AA35LPQ5_9HYPO|nr:unnamed protein product [Clonostachys chloroleuca]
MALEAPYRLPGKIKEMTRGQASETPTVTENEEAILDEDDIEVEKIPVNARALRNDFTYALTSTGLFTAQHLYGSIWRFSRTDGTINHVTFHQPHPNPKIPFRKMRRNGRLLNESYGWTGDMFILK